MTKKRRDSKSSGATKPSATPLGKICNHRLTPLAAGVISALYPMSPLLAQDDDFRIEEIIVTATKRQISLQDVPHSIDVLSAVDLERMGAQTMNDIVKALPSVALVATQPGRHSLVMRGISTGAYEYRTDSQVAVYLDEQPMTTNSQQVGVRVIDMARIESLAGPQGTLFGSSSQTGTIRYITNKPDHEGTYGSIEARYGSTTGGSDSYDISGHVNLPMVHEVLSLRAVGYTSHDGGYVDNVFGTSFEGGYDNAAIVANDINEYDTDGGRIALQWNMGDDWSALIGVIAERTEATGTWETDPFLGDHKITRFHPEFRDDEWYSASVTLRGDLGFADLTLTATQYDRDIVYEWDNHAYSQDKDAYFGGGLYYAAYYAGDPYYFYYFNYGLYDTDYYRSITFNDQTQQRDTLEIRLASKGDSRFQWMVGGYYEDVYDEWYFGARVPGYTNTRSFYAANVIYAYYWGVFGFYDYACYCYVANPNQAYPVPATDVGFSNTLKRSVEQIAVFGEVSYDLNDQWTVIGGVRWAEFDRNTFSRFAFPEGLVPFQDRMDGDGSFRDIGKNDDTIYKFSVRYNIDDQKMLYGLFSQGFRLGGLNSPRAANTGQVPLVYDPDFLDNYEFGIKSQWLDNRLQINADVFFMEWSNYQQDVAFNEWWLRGIVNARTAETKGIEVQVEWQITKHLRFAGNVFFADPEFTEDWENNFVDGILDIRAGMPMPNSPEKKAHLSLFYEVPNVLGGDMWFYYDFFYQSETWNRTFDIVNNNTNGLAPSWTESNFSTGIDFPNQFSLVLNVKNLFDETGYDWVATFDNVTSDLFGDPRFRDVRTLSRPRTVWLHLRKDFGG